MNSFNARRQVCSLRFGCSAIQAHPKKKSSECLGHSHHLTSPSQQSLPLTPVSFAQALAIALLAFATLAYAPPDDWLAACVDHGMSIVDDFDAQAVANAVWALALMDHLPACFWSALMKPFEAACKGLKGKRNHLFAPKTHSVFGNV